MDILKSQFDKALNKVGVLCINSQNNQFRAIYQQIKDSDSNDSLFLLVVKDSVNQGELLSIENRQYLVTLCNRDYNQVYDRLSLEIAHLPLKFIADEKLNVTYCLSNVGGMSVASSSTISVLDGKAQFCVPKTIQTLKIAVNDRFIKFGGAWKVDKITNESEGILSIWTHVDSIASGDDLINEIPNGLPVYTLEYTPLSYNLTTGATQQITPIVTKNGQSISTGFRMTYTSSNPSIATVDSNGLITASGEGSATITGYLNDDVKTATVSVSVTSVQVVTVEIMPQVKTLLQNSEQVYTVYKKINGVVQSDTFNIVGSVAPTTNYTLTVLNGNSFKVKNLKLWSSGKLKVTCTATDGINSNYIEIQLKGAF